MTSVRKKQLLGLLLLAGLGAGLVLPVTSKTTTYNGADLDFCNLGKLIASDADEDDLFGCAVSISEEVAVIGAYSDNHPGGTVTDPSGPLSGSTYVVRGGHWLTDAQNCRSASRSMGPSSGGNQYIGFRVALVQLPRN